MPNLASPNARADETIDEVSSEQDRQHVEENYLVEHQHKAHEQRGHNRFGKSAGRTKAQRFEAGIFNRADHHRGEEDQNGSDEIIPFAEDFIFFIDVNDKECEGSH